jgi:hypothetical protein
MNKSASLTPVQWKQREDSAILLASNRPHNKDQTKKDRKGKEQGKTKIFLREDNPTYTAHSQLLDGGLNVPWLQGFRVATNSHPLRRV